MAVPQDSEQEEGEIAESPANPGSGLQLDSHADPAVLDSKLGDHSKVSELDGTGLDTSPSEPRPDFGGTPVLWFMTEDGSWVRSCNEETQEVSESKYSTASEGSRDSASSQGHSGPEQESPSSSKATSASSKESQEDEAGEATGKPVVEKEEGELEEGEIVDDSPVGDPDTAGRSEPELGADDISQSGGSRSEVPPRSSSRARERRHGDTDVSLNPASRRESRRFHVSISPPPPRDRRRESQSPSRGRVASQSPKRRGDRHASDRRYRRRSRSREQDRRRERSLERRAGRGRSRERRERRRSPFVYRRLSSGRRLSVERSLSRDRKRRREASRERAEAIVSKFWDRVDTDKKDMGLEGSPKADSGNKESHGDVRRGQPLKEAERLAKDVTVQKALQSLPAVCSKLEDALVHMQKATSIAGAHSREEVLRVADAVFFAVRTTYMVATTGAGRNQEKGKQGMVLSLIKLAHKHRSRLFSNKQKKEIETWLEHLTTKAAELKPAPGDPAGTTEETPPVKGTAVVSVSHPTLTAPSNVPPSAGSNPSQTAKPLPIAVQITSGDLEDLKKKAVAYARGELQQVGGPARDPAFLAAYNLPSGPLPAFSIPTSRAPVDTFQPPGFPQPSVTPAGPPGFLFHNSLPEQPQQPASHEPGAPLELIEEAFSDDEAQPMATSPRRLSGCSEGPARGLDLPPGFRHQPETPSANLQTTSLAPPWGVETGPVKKAQSQGSGPPKPLQSRPQKGEVPSSGLRISPRRTQLGGVRRSSFDDDDDLPEEILEPPGFTPPVGRAFEGAWSKGTSAPGGGVDQGPEESQQKPPGFGDLATEKHAGSVVSKRASSHDSRGGLDVAASKAAEMGAVKAVSVTAVSLGKRTRSSSEGGEEVSRGAKRSTTGNGVVEAKKTAEPGRSEERKQLDEKLLLRLKEVRDRQSREDAAEQENEKKSRGEEKGGEKPTKGGPNKEEDKKGGSSRKGTEAESKMQRHEGNVQRESEGREKSREGSRHESAKGQRQDRGRDGVMKLDGEARGRRLDEARPTSGDKNRQRSDGQRLSGERQGRREENGVPESPSKRARKGSEALRSPRKSGDGRETSDAQRGGRNKLPSARERRITEVHREGAEVKPAGAGRGDKGLVGEHRQKNSTSVKDLDRKFVGHELNALQASPREESGQKVRALVNGEVHFAAPKASRNANGVAEQTVGSHEATPPTTRLVHGQSAKAPSPMVSQPAASATSNRQSKGEKSSVPLESDSVSAKGAPDRTTRKEARASSPAGSRSSSPVPTRAASPALSGSRTGAGRPSTPHGGKVELSNLGRPPKVPPPREIVQPALRNGAPKGVGSVQESGNSALVLSTADSVETAMLGVFLGGVESDPGKGVRSSELRGSGELAESQEKPANGKVEKPTLSGGAELASNGIPGVVSHGAETKSKTIKSILKRPGSAGGVVLGNSELGLASGMGDGRVSISPRVEAALSGLDEKGRAAVAEERMRRLEEQARMIEAKKLCLVLDLDHTLLNSATFFDIDKAGGIWAKKLEAKLAGEDALCRADPTRHRELHRFPDMLMWTKLRPGVSSFLKKASQLYELHVYTMGNAMYATRMAQLLDPTGAYFAGRIISKGDTLDSSATSPGEPPGPLKSKDLDGVLGMESCVLIIDDSAKVWPHHFNNLIVVERYMFFPGSKQQFGQKGPALFELGHDEREHDGMLASACRVIEQVHRDFFRDLQANQSREQVDAREILQKVQKSVLQGVRILFSRVFPQGTVHPEQNLKWRTAEQFGATCTTTLDDSVTHVIAMALGTDKVCWALKNGRHVVSPHWLEASAILYKRANELHFPVLPNSQQGKDGANKLPN